MRRSGRRRRQMQMPEIVTVMMVIEGRAASGRPAGVKEDQSAAGRPGKDRLPVPDQSGRLLHHQVLRPRRGIRLRRPREHSRINRSIDFRYTLRFQRACRPNGLPRQDFGQFRSTVIPAVREGQVSRLVGHRSARKYHLRFIPHALPVCRCGHFRPFLALRSIDAFVDQWVNFGPVRSMAPFAAITARLTLSSVTLASSIDARSAGSATIRLIDRWPYEVQGHRQLFRRR
jgi:hypothetical protein